MLSVRAWQVLLIVSTVGLSWLLMMLVHELGHVLNAWLSGGVVNAMLLHPLAISRTDVSPNPHPQFVAWGGAIWGGLFPLGIWLVARHFVHTRGHWLRFFAGFCCLANGLYLAAGSFTGAGDAGDLMRNGAPQWLLVAVGAPLSLLGLGLWNGLGEHFGFGMARGHVEPRLAIRVSVVLLLLACAMALMPVP